MVLKEEFTRTMYIIKPLIFNDNIFHTIYSLKPGFPKFNLFLPKSMRLLLKNFIQFHSSIDVVGLVKNKQSIKKKRKMIFVSMESHIWNLWSMNYWDTETTFKLGIRELWFHDFFHYKFTWSQKCKKKILKLNKAVYIS